MHHTKGRIFGQFKVRLLAVFILLGSVLFPFAPSAEANIKLPGLGMEKPRVADHSDYWDNVYQVEIEGTTKVTITSNAGGSADLSLGEDLPEAFGDAYVFSSGNGYELFLPLAKDYTITFINEEEPIDVTVYKINAEGVTTYAAKYCDCVWEIAVQSRIELKQSGIGDLYYDSDSNGSFDTKVDPFMKDQNEQGVDLDSPYVEAKERYGNGERQVWLTATDNNGATRIEYYFDTPSQYTEDEDGVLDDYEVPVVDVYEYDQPIPVTSGSFGQSVYFIAYDAVGNTSDWQEYMIGSVNPSFNGTDIPSWAGDGDVIRFDTDHTVYVVADDIALLPFQNMRVLRYYLDVSGKEIMYSDEDPSFYSRYALNTVESEVGGWINLCDDHPFATGSQVVDKGTVYLIIGCLKIPFHNAESFLGLGYSFSKVIPADLAKYEMIETAGISSKEVPHTWGSWVNHKGTIYYSHPEGMIGITSFDLFLQNGGSLSLVVPANKYDIAEIENAFMYAEKNDVRITEINFFGPLQETEESEDYLSIEMMRDDKRLADVRMLASALELYFNDYSTYPIALNDLLTTNIISSIPEAPTPPDGDCTESQNAYTYFKMSDESYKLNFCLGGDLYGLPAGVRTLSEEGLR